MQELTVVAKLKLDWNHHSTSIWDSPLSDLVSWMYSYLFAWKRCIRAYGHRGWEITLYLPGSIGHALLCMSVGRRYLPAIY